MFRSIQSRFLGLNVGVVLATSALLVLFFTAVLVKTILFFNHQNVNNLMRLVHLDLESAYNELTYFEDFVISFKKQKLQDMTRLFVESAQTTRGLSKSTDQQIQENLKRVAGQFQYDRNGFFYVYKDYVAIAHFVHKQIGKNFYNAQDPAGHYVLRDLMKASQQLDGGFSTYLWPKVGHDKPVRKLGFARYIKEWNWMVGSGIYLDDIDEIVAQKKQDLIDGLKSVFDKLPLIKKGYVILFSPDGTMLIRSRTHDKSPFDENLLNTNPKLLKSLTEAAKTKRLVALSLPTSHGGAIDIRARVDYFSPLGWYVGAIFYQSDIVAPILGNITATVGFAILILGISGVLSFWMVRRVSRPILALAKSTSDFASNDFSGSDEALVLLQTDKSEIGILAKTFTDMQTRLQTYILNLKETTAQKERIESELNIARNIQMSMLPNSESFMKNRTGVKIAAFIEPAKQIGGDFYDFFPIDEDNVGILVADVSGKGVPAAMLMAVTKTMLKSAASRLLKPEEVLTAVNDELSADNDAAMFVTVFYGVINVKTEKLTYCSGGHNLPYHISGKTVTVFKQTAGMALGVMEGMSFAADTISLKSGDKLVLYTDGVTEAFNIQKEMFSDAGLEETLKKLGRVSAQDLTRGIVSAVKTFVGEADPSDDITVMTIGFKEV